MKTAKYLNPAHSRMLKAFNAFWATLMLLICLFFVFCLVLATPLETDMGGLARGLALVAQAVFQRFGILAWALPFTCLLSAALIWRARAINSLLPLWVGMSWSIVCGASLLGGLNSTISLAGMEMSWGGVVGRAMAANLEVKLGSWVNFLLVFNLCLLGLALVCWSIMPVLWNWKKNAQPQAALLDEQELLRQAVLQGVHDARQQLAQVVQVEVEAQDDFVAQEEGDDPELLVNIGIDHNPAHEPIIGPAPSGAYLRPVLGGALAVEDSPADSLETTTQTLPDKLAKGLNPWSEAADQGQPGPESINAEEEISEAETFEPEVADAKISEPEEIDSEIRKAIVGINALQTGGQISFAATGEEESENALPGLKILARQDEPIIDSGGTVAKLEPESGYELPSLDLLQPPPSRRTETQSNLLAHNSRLLEEKLANFGVQGQVVEVAPGPVVTMYEFKPAPGVKISKVAGLSDDLAMNMKATSVRIVAPIPGKSVIGIEIPSPERETVYLRELLASDVYRQSASPVSVALGKDIMGQPVVSDLARMPHLLIAGATGAGKSVFINTLVLSILYRSTPNEVRLLMVDPKRIELSTYNHIPHLLYPIITQPKEATAGLRWAVAEMERRYDLLAEMGVRNIASYNQRQAQEGRQGMPYIVVIIDELADLMMVASKEVETLITRLAQMARASGIHLVLATQRPSVDVITGLIKANFPARLSFQVSSRIDSRTILDAQGAETLLGAGDMLFLPPGTAGLRRLHAAFVSDEEIEAVVDFVKQQGQPQYDKGIESIIDNSQEGPGGENGEEVDELYQEAVNLVRHSGQASISNIQRRLRVGYNRAARMIEQMEADGIVGPSDGSRPREVYQRD